MDDELNKFIVSPNIEILDILKKIDYNMNGIVYVCDNEDKLIGAITDGDIRRYILKNSSVSGTASLIMNSSPKALFADDINITKDYMLKNNIKSLPIINNKGKIIQIIFLNKVMKDKVPIKIPVVIMAGGKGTRLYPYTQILPKPLIPINNKTITELIMDSFEEYNCEEFIMIVNYKKEFIKAFFKENEYQRNIEFVDENEFMGTAGGLKLLKGKLKSTFFMTNCDILIEDDYSKIYDYHKNKKNIITIVCALKKEVFPYGTVEANEDGSILALKEKPTFEFLTNTGFYVIEPSFLDYIPDRTFIHITDIIQICINENLKVGAYPIQEKSWMDMGQIEELEKMKERMKNNNG